MGCGGRGGLLMIELSYRVAPLAETQCVCVKHVCVHFIHVCSMFCFHRNHHSAA